MGQANRLLQRQAWRIPHHASVREGPRSWPDAVWPSALRAQHRHHLRQHPTGQGSCAPEFIREFNTRFGKDPRNPKDMHRSLAAHENLEGAMYHKEVRTLSQALMLRYDEVLFILDPTDLAKRLAGKKVVVYDYPDGGLEIVHEGTALSYRTFDKLRSVTGRRLSATSALDAALTMVAE